MKDPLNPNNQLPYVDGVKQLIIPDTSTALAALRTAKLDVMEAVAWDDTVSLQKTSPELQYNIVVSAPFLPVGRLDKTGPALQGYQGAAGAQHGRGQAVTDRQVLCRSRLHAGLSLPAHQGPTLRSTPRWSSSPQAVQDLFKYNPDKAKQASQGRRLSQRFQDDDRLRGERTWTCCPSSRQT